VSRSPSTLRQTDHTFRQRVCRAWQRGTLMNQ
jgi:hypothetical protein